MPDWTFLHDRLHTTLRQRHLLPKNQSILLAVSGGQDSLCLAQLLIDLQPKWNWRLAIAHCNHRWRLDADANANYVAQLTQAWRLPYYSAVASDPLSSEASARDWRYGELASIALQHQYTTVVTGHTESDRAETLLYNLIRGSGAEGLQALAWNRQLVDGVQLVRPLLTISRQQTAQFCQDTELQVWNDSTNQDWRYARNRIREELLPYLQTHFNPQVEQALAQTAELLRAEVECLEQWTDTLYEQAVDAGDNAVQAQRINRTILKSAPLALQRRSMRRFLHQYLAAAPNFEQIEKITALIAAPNRSQTDPFLGGAIARVVDQWIVLMHP